jgi:hypothetical protein
MEKELPLKELPLTFKIRKTKKEEEKRMKAAEEKKGVKERRPIVDPGMRARSMVVFRQSLEEEKPVQRRRLERSTRIKDYIRKYPSNSHR